MKKFEGKILFLDRSDINTDEIIPAKYLTETTKETLRAHLFEDLNLEGFNYNEDIKGKGVIVSRRNFGCGSSREHAPWAIEQNGINVVVAEGFARIFRQNMFNCGMLAIELPKDDISRLFKNFSDKNTYIAVDLQNETIIVSDDHHKEDIKFNLAPFDKDLILTGGWIDYVAQNYT